MHEDTLKHNLRSHTFPKHDGCRLDGGCAWAMQGGHSRQSTKAAAAAAAAVGRQSRAPSAHNGRCLSLAAVPKHFNCFIHVFYQVQPPLALHIWQVPCLMAKMSPSWDATLIQQTGGVSIEGALTERLAWKAPSFCRC
jgi:hypothetical protein